MGPTESYAGLPVVYAGAMVISPITIVTATVAIEPCFHLIHCGYPVQLIVGDNAGPMSHCNVLKRV